MVLTPYTPPRTPRGRSLTRDIVEAGIRYAGRRASSAIAGAGRRALDSAAQSVMSRGSSLIRAGAKRARGAFSRSRSSAGGSGAGAVLSTQHDQSLRYRSKRMSRKTRKRLRFAKRIRGIMDDQQSPCTYTLKGSVNSSVAADSVTVFAIGTYNVGGDGGEIPLMFADAYGGGNANVTRICVRNATLDLEISNTGSNLMILDVYTLICRKEYQTVSTLGAQWTTQFNLQNTVGSKSATDPSNTVFQNSEFCKYWKILTKREVRLGAGEVTTMQERQPRNRYIQGVRLANEPQYLKGLSKAFLIMYHGAPINNAGTAQLAAGNLTYSWQKAYDYAQTSGANKDNVHNN